MLPLTTSATMEMSTVGTVSAVKVRVPEPWAVQTIPASCHAEIEDGTGEGRTQFEEVTPLTETVAVPLDDQAETAIVKVV